METVGLRRTTTKRNKARDFLGWTALLIWIWTRIIWPVTNSKSHTMIWTNAKLSLRRIVVIHLPMACLSGLSGGSTNISTLMAPRTIHGTLSKYAWKPARRCNVKDSRNVTRRENINCSPSSCGVGTRTESLLTICHSSASCTKIQTMHSFSFDYACIGCPWKDNLSVIIYAPH